MPIERLLEQLNLWKEWPEELPKGLVATKKIGEPDYDCYYDCSGFCDCKYDCSYCPCSQCK